MKHRKSALVVLLLLVGMTLYLATRNESQMSEPQPLAEKLAADVQKIKQDKVKDPAKDNPGSEEETQRLLKEAANRRFKVNRPEGMLNQDPDVAEDLTRQVAVEMLLETLIREKIEKNPDYVTETESRLLTRKPRIMTLTQKDSEGELRTIKVLVADTRACEDRMNRGNPALVKVEDLESDYCMHRTLEYPGGFDANRPLQLSIGPVTDKGQFAEMDRQWDRLLKIAMREAITAEFVPRYKESGALTL